ncbi:MAG TPA: FMN-binding negative transcriptional regulator [Azospirillum sp.]
MYVPAHFTEDDPATLYALIRAHGFGLLVTQTAEGPFATHLPFLLDAGEGRPAILRGHVARANPQWKHFADGGEALAVFQGPHAYVSPTWYAKRAGAVPTWNYAAVHIYGRPTIIEDAAAVDGLLDALSSKYEAGRPDAWSLAELEPKAREAMRRGIVAFELPVTRIEGKAKLSQNRPAEDRAGVIAGLEAAGDPDSLATARLMAARG